MKSGQTIIPIPEYVRSCLWSYDIGQLDLRSDQGRIITNVLNYGTTQAVDWLFSVYPKEAIKEVVSQPIPGEWNKKSINFWSLIFEVPMAYRARRFV